MSVRDTEAGTQIAGGNPSAARGWLRALEMTASIGQHPQPTLPVIIDELAGIFGDVPALLSDDECFSFRALAERSRRYRRWALAQGLAKGEAVCLLMPNRPEYMAAWLGITRAGGVAALLNTNLTGSSLAHCINHVRPRHIIVDESLVDALLAAQTHLDGVSTIWSYGDRRFPDITRDIERHSGDMLAGVEQQQPTIGDRALYIYTSGTTGLPKAAIVTHHRLLIWSLWFAGMMDTRP